MLASDVHVITGKNVPGPVIEALLRVTWERSDQLLPLHPVFRDWQRGRLAAPEATLPYHPAAVSFYRERGVWTAELEQVQQRLLGLNVQ